MTTLPAMTDIELLRYWQEKALVCVCRDHQARQETTLRGGSHYTCGGSPGVDWCGPQRKAATAKREIDRRAIPLPKGWWIGLSEDNSCGRRKLSARSPCEFDELMNAHIAGLEAAL